MAEDPHFDILKRFVKLADLAGLQSLNGTSLMIFRVYWNYVRDSRMREVRLHHLKH